MAKTLLVSSRLDAALAASLTSFITIGSGRLNIGDSVEANATFPSRTSGVYSNLYINVTSNDRGASTLVFRKNGADGNQSISIPSSTTGEFEDIVNVDSVAVADTVCTRLITGSGGTTFVLQKINVVWRSSVGTITQSSSLAGVTTATASQTLFCSYIGQSRFETSEARSQWRSRTAGTLRNLFAKVETNARSTSTTISTRVAGANGSLTISVPATTTGNFEDTTNTDSVASGNMIGYRQTTGTGTGNFGISILRAEFLTYTGQAFMASCSINTTVVNSNVTNYLFVGGRLDATTTESKVKADADIPMRLSNLQVYVFSNGVTAASTIRLRKNSANANQSVSITASTTGWFEDTTNVDDIASTDEINFSLVTGATGTNIALTVIGCLVYSKEPRFFFGA